MAVAVLPPYDLLNSPISTDFLVLSPASELSTKSNFRNPNRARANRRKRGSSNEKSQKPALSDKASHPRGEEDAPFLAKKDLVMGQVKILKRGEDVAAVASSGRTSDVIKTEQSAITRDLVERLDPVLNRISDQEILSEQIRSVEPNEFYAGSAIVTSPSPRSLPLPSNFFRKGKNEDATGNLRRMLRLDLL